MPGPDASRPTARRLLPWAAVAVLLLLVIYFLAHRSSVDPVCGPCPTGAQLCDHVSSSCVACTSADTTKCSPSKQVCSGGACVACTSDDVTKCPSGRPFCGSGACVACTGGNVDQCDAGQKLCDGGACVACTSDNVSQCPADRKKCAGGACVACANTADCATGHFCEGGNCVACLADDDGDPPCVPCTSKDDCNKTGVAGGPRGFCSTADGATPPATRYCVECNHASDCVGSVSNPSPQCPVSGDAAHTCVECDNHLDCAG